MKRKTVADPTVEPDVAIEPTDDKAVVDRLESAPSQTSVVKKDPLADIGGSKSAGFNYSLLRRVLATFGGKLGSEADPDSRIEATAAALRSFKPTDEIEGMLAAQAVAMHHVAMECFRRAMIPEQPSETASKLRKDGANLSRAMADMLDALDRYRGKGPQVVRVERVVVQEGGQAVVGNVQTGGIGG